MISKNQIKYIRSLSLKKNRHSLALFIAEGDKLVTDLLPYFTCRMLFFLPESELSTQLPTIDAPIIEEVTKVEMDKLSSLSTSTSVLAVFEQKRVELSVNSLKNELVLVLDEVQNPGNLGTIIRIADWFGIKHIICSPASADNYNSKTIQATMGALARVQIHYMDLLKFFEQYRSLKLPIYGTFLDGQNLYQSQLQPAGVIVMGNEGSGISKEIEELVTKRLFIPNYPLGELTSESLNVAVATAIVCSEFRRR